jgi:uncharacterized phiE125 gp8 family phage protein
MSDALLELVTPPSTDTLDVEFVRDEHLRAPGGDAEDAYIESLIVTSLRMAERITRRSLYPTTWALTLERFPAGAIAIPRPPLQSVVSITYIDTDGIEQTLDPARYQVRAAQGPLAARGRILPAYGETWPATRCQMDAVTVTFVAGYAQVPEDITHARLLIIGELYKQRSESVHTINQNPALIRARDLLMPYRVY